MTRGVDALVFLALCVLLVWLGKLVYGLFHPGARVDREVTARDNVAFAVPLGGYYLGILIVVGAPLSSPSRGSLPWDAVFVAGWGVLAVLLLNVASVASRRVLFRGLDLGREVQRGNMATGVVLAGSHVANALLILGALSDEGGLLPAGVFWIYAQVLLEAAAVAFFRIVRYDVVDELARDNRAVAFVVAGVLVAMGNVLRMSVTGPFEGWAAGFAATTAYAVAGLALLFVARWLTDWLLLPGVTFREEVVEQNVPNVGVGYLEAIFYVGASLLVGWSL
jgi:uncharacterized membrane protein YjfL (UPF0719 family)